MSKEMNEKTEQVFDLVLGVIKIISGFMVLIGVLFLSNKIVGLEKENAVLEERLAMKIFTKLNKPE